MIDKLKKNLRDINKKINSLKKQKNIPFFEINKLENIKTLIKKKIKVLIDKDEKDKWLKKKTLKFNKPTKKKLNADRKRLTTKLDLVFSKYIRLRDCDDRGLVSCITCPKIMKVYRIEDWKLLFNKWVHNCHRISRRYFSHRRDEDNCYTGCDYCNTYDWENHHTLFTVYQTKKYWIDWVDRQLRNKNCRKLSVEELENLIKKYEKKLNKLIDDILKSK